MARTHQAYPPEFRRQMVELVKSGRTPQELAREYEPSAGSIRNWVAHVNGNRKLRIRECAIYGCRQQPRVSGTQESAATV